MFNIGDLVIGNDKASRNYGITQKGFIGEVISVDGNLIEIRGESGNEYTVSSDCFDLYKTSDATSKLSESNMSVLLRDNYKWVKAYFDIARNAIVAEGKSILRQWDIIDIKNNDMTNYVQCANCGTIIPNTDEAKLEHQNRYKRADVCIDCRYLRTENKKELLSEMSEDANGNYVLSKSYRFTCYCGMKYCDTPIKTAKESCCRYSKCNQFELIENFHTKYPHAFSKIATVDALDDKKWKIDTAKTINSHYMFKASKRFTLYAAVNKFGIIDYFVYKYRDSSYVFAYSEKYNKLFWRTRSGDIVDNYTNYDVDDVRYNELLTTVSNIYKGE